MRQLTNIFYISFIFLMLFGCSSNTIEPTNNSHQNNADIETSAEPDSLTENNVNIEASVETDHSASEADSSMENNTIQDEEDMLSEYSNEQIEYARVWLQLGPNQDVDELYVQHISNGESVNPNDDTSANYPEDVIQLSGSRLIDGSITYSGNGDGTINLYNVPLRWEDSVPEDLDENYMNELTKNMIDNRELISIDTGDDEKVVRLIQLIRNIN